MRENVLGQPAERECAPFQLVAEGAGRQRQVLRRPLSGSESVALPVRTTGPGRQSGPTGQPEIPGLGPQGRSRGACNQRAGKGKRSEVRATGEYGLLAAGVQASGGAGERTGRRRLTNPGHGKTGGRWRDGASRCGDTKRVRGRRSPSQRRPQLRERAWQRACGLPSQGGSAASGLLRAAVSYVALPLTDSLQSLGGGARTECLRGCSRVVGAAVGGPARAVSKPETRALRGNVKAGRHGLRLTACNWHAAQSKRGCEDACHDRDRQIRISGSAHAHAALTRGREACIHYEHAHDGYLLNNVMTKRTCSEITEQCETDRISVGLCSLVSLFFKDAYLGHE